RVSLGVLLMERNENEHLGGCYGSFENRMTLVQFQQTITCFHFVFFLSLRTIAKKANVVECDVVRNPGDGVRHVRAETRSSHRDQSNLATLLREARRKVCDHGVDGALITICD